MRTAIQLWTLRKVDEPLPALLRRVGETALDGVEFAGLDGTLREVSNALQEAGLAAAGAHVPVEALEADPEEAIAPYRQLGCGTIVVPYLDEGHFSDRKAVEGTGGRLDGLAAALEDVRLSYHNHDHEFRETGDALEVLVGASEHVFLEVDVGWALAAGLDPAALLGQLDRITHVHLKDVDAARGRPVELGEGDLDVVGCAQAAREAGAEWLVYEHDDPTDPLASLAHGAETLASL